MDGASFILRCVFEICNAWKNQEANMEKNVMNSLPKSGSFQLQSEAKRIIRACCLPPFL